MLSFFEKGWKSWKKTPFPLIIGLYVILNFLLRIALVYHPITETQISLGSFLKISFWGALQDMLIGVLISVFGVLYTLFLSNQKYYKPWGYVLFFAGLLWLLYIIFFHTVLDDYGRDLANAVIIFVTIKVFFFGICLFLPKYRAPIRLLLYSTLIFLYVFLIYINGLTEYYFWNEFGVRYNFIAVDYLIYTNIIITNVFQSFSVIPILIGCVIITVATTWWMVKKTKLSLNPLPNFSTKISMVITYLVAVGIALFFIPKIDKLASQKNVFIHEIQSNGINKFVYAFRHSELDFFSFYPLLTDKESFQLVQHQLDSTNKTFSPLSISRAVQGNLPIKKNIVLITIESMSAEFMKYFGNQENITPFLDSLSKESLFFSNLYAVGNRTVRGLEAVTLSLPPTPGESVVKRKDNKNKFTIGSVLKAQGYTVQYLYGGDSFFDNMGDFYGGNGYEVIDRKFLAPEETSFENIWGVCDEDMAKKAISIMNKDASTGNPFFVHWMTVSNHRPFTYPENKINISPLSKSRSGGVKYTDYALQQFFKMAAKQTWFNETIFVIISDHCASSAGERELPLDRYRIPAMIYAPGFVQPKNFNQRCSQIDVMPTLFSILQLNYEANFFGQNVLDSNYQPRAFIATYQDLGFIKDDVLTLLSPVKQVKQYKLIPQENKEHHFYPPLLYEQQLLSTPNPTALNQTIANYQAAAYLLKHKQYDLK